MGVYAFTGKTVGTGGLLLGLVLGAAVAPAHASAGPGAGTVAEAAAPLTAGAGPGAGIGGRGEEIASEVKEAVNRLLCGAPLPKPLAPFMGKVKCVNGWQ
ncbi:MULTISPECIES: hypothetical protein [Streptomyces]|uniref:hypothetical protein n=1 Tax=Streptomyces TaxID=1883 RepID=UPI0004C4C9A9|nr:MULTISPECIES: hypothetical protein [Streptomyces]MDX3734974.1 hypothetical protein [Streptomyces sp. ID01-15D]